MKKYRIIIGIDVSKHKLDVCFLSCSNPDSKQLSFLVVSNDQKGIRKVLRAIKKEKIDIKDILFCF